MQSIASIKDNRVIHARSLAAAAGRRRAHECLLFGAHQIAWALQAGMQLDHVFVAQHHEADDFIKNLEVQGVPVLEVSVGIIKKITATNFLIPVVGIARVQEVAGGNLPREKLLLVFDHIAHHRQFGAMVRNAQSFGIRNVVIAQEQGDVFYRQLIEASRGAVFSSTVHTFDGSLNTVQALKRGGYQIVVSAPQVQGRGCVFDIHDDPVALVVGSPQLPVREEFLDAADVVLTEPIASWALRQKIHDQTDIEGLAVLKLRMLLALLGEQLNKKMIQHPGHAALIVTQAFQRELAKITELSLPHVFLLMQLIAERIISFDSIAKQYAWQTAAVGEFVQPLVNKGIVERFGHPMFEGVRITLRGEQLLERCWLVLEYVQETLFRGFSDKERQLTSDFLLRLSNNASVLL